MQNWMLIYNQLNWFLQDTSEEWKWQKKTKNWLLRGTRPRTVSSMDHTEILPGRRNTSTWCRISCWIWICIQICPAILDKRRNRGKRSKIDHLEVPDKEQSLVSTIRKYCRAMNRNDFIAEFFAESESAFKTARQYLWREGKTKKGTS